MAELTYTPLFSDTATQQVSALLSLAAQDPEAAAQLFNTIGFSAGAIGGAPNTTSGLGKMPNHSPEQRREYDDKHEEAVYKRAMRPVTEAKAEQELAKEGLNNQKMIEDLIYTEDGKINFLDARDAARYSPYANNVYNNELGKLGLGATYGVYLDDGSSLSDKLGVDPAPIGSAFRTIAARNNLPPETLIGSIDRMHWDFVPEFLGGGLGGSASRPYRGLVGQTAEFLAKKNGINAGGALSSEVIDRLTDTFGADPTRSLYAADVGFDPRYIGDMAKVHGVDPQTYIEVLNSDKTGDLWLNHLKQAGEYYNHYATDRQQLK